VSARTVTIAVGATLLFDSAVARVVEFDGGSVTLRLPEGRYLGVELAEFVTRAKGMEPLEGEDDPGLVLAGLDATEREQIARKAAHVREVLTGYAAGHAGAASPGEPRPEFAPGVPLKARYAAKAVELSVGVRTVEYWVAAYREAGEAGLVDDRHRRGLRSSVDPRWDAALGAELVAGVRASTPTRGAVLMRVAARLEGEHGPSVVPIPSKSTAYRRLAQLSKGTNAVSGSAKARRSIAERPKGVYGGCGPPAPASI
jgi:Helix-turn-helix domain